MCAFGKMIYAHHVCALQTSLNAEAFCPKTTAPVLTSRATSPICASSAAQWRDLSTLEGCFSRKFKFRSFLHDLGSLSQTKLTLSSRVVAYAATPPPTTPATASPAPHHGRVQVPKECARQIQTHNFILQRLCTDCAVVSFGFYPLQRIC